MLHTLVYNVGMMNDNLIKIYFKQISVFPLLTKDQEMEYFQQLAQGKMSYRNKILNSNLRFVVTEAKKFINRGLDLMDLISAGNVGLTEAIDHFDLSKGVKFITYAVWWIDEEIRRALCEAGRCVKIPTNKKEMLNEKKWQAYSLDTPVAAENSDSASTYLDMLEDNVNINPEDECIRNIMVEKIKLRIKTLKNREQTVVNLRYGLNSIKPGTLTEIAEHLNLSKERVRQIEKEAILQLQEQVA